jgi:phosphatidylglycerophosphate synthase
MSRLPVFWYIPNVLCYIRIILALSALTYAPTAPWTAVSLWLTAGFMDFMDGWIARRFQQTSTYGVLLDVIADNTCRSSIWMAVAAQDPRRFLVVACILTSIEWLTFFATQFHAATQRSHWKLARSKDPKWIQTFFRRHFRNPLGIWGILGLFGANLCAFARVHHLFPMQTKQILYNSIFYIMEGVCYSGRAISLAIEMYLVCQYFSLLLRQDTEQGQAASVPTEIQTAPNGKRPKSKKKVKE